jgi:hypothetical protein
MNGKNRYGGQKMNNKKQANAQEILNTIDTYDLNLLKALRDCVDVRIMKKEFEEAKK